MNKRRTINPRWKKFSIVFLGTIAVIGFAVSVFAFIGIFTVQPPESAVNSVSVQNPVETAVSPDNSESVSDNQSSENKQPENKPTLFSQVNRSSGCNPTQGEPVDNPIASFYGKEAYPWTNQLRWDCVYNINNFSGSNLIEKFNKARDAAAANGGGVVYFPAGTYTFSDNIKLKDGVILRGETPSVKDAKSANYSPPSKFVFPKYEPKLSGNGTPNDTAFKKISTENPLKDSNFGLVNLDINRASISILAEMDNQKNKNIVVFGIRSNNVAEPDPNVPDISFQEPWQRYSYRFAANIELTASENILAANNRVNDEITDNFEQPGYKLKTRDRKSVLTYTDGKKAIFHYGNHYGIVVNRFGKGGEGFQLAATPQTEPGLFRPGVVIRDNWVYHTMRVAIHASGQGLIIKDNEIKDQAKKQWWLHPTGMLEASGAVTLENRGIDWSGWDVLVEGNNYEVYRHLVGETGYLSVDGEGILIQECCGGTIVKGATIRNNQGNAYIGFYKVQEMENVTIENNRVNNADILVLADTNNRPYAMKNVKVLNNNIGGNIVAKASAGGNGNIIQGNVGNGGKIEHTCSVEVKNNQGFDVKPCQ
ncbi:glycosyl hydrolase family 28-related protein [Capilliphycus salinus ALCB114379]|uniref:glycosyl hydrolase family 28-related protein n=1 Tax=Capilliphycus salinus TaxID=2768948 RepID=UPI0039A4EFE5